MRAGVTVFGGIVAGAGLAIAVVYLLAAGSQTARLVWNLAPSKLGLPDSSGTWLRRSSVCWRGSHC
jgi:hypothetical protein